VHGVQLTREPQLLADRGLAYPDGFSDLPLGHPGREHGSQRKDAPQPSDILLATSSAELSH
jgi:hypothetical protein